MHAMKSYAIIAGVVFAQAFVTAPTSPPPLNKLLEQSR
jgi:hypothetical protein